MIHIIYTTLAITSFLQFAFAQMNMDLSSYPGKTHDEKLNSAFTCMSAVKAKALPGIRANGFELAGNCLRYGFHDCGTFDKTNPNSKGGCNGGIRTTIASAIVKGVYDTPANPNPEDGGMRGCQNLLVGLDGKSGICNQVRLENKNTCGNMPFADCINFSAYLAVLATGGAPVDGCPWLPGRVDVPVVQKTALLPSEKSNANNLLVTFGTYDMKYKQFSISTLDETVVLLSGAHTIGRSRVHGKNICSKGLNALGATPKAFDTDYYVKIVANLGRVDNNGGWFCSDMHGICNTISYEKSNIVQVGLDNTTPDLTKGLCKSFDSPFKSLYLKYAGATQPEFHNNFCKAYQAMSFIGYNIPTNHTQDALKFAKLLKA